jgi:hypothetical protein
MKTALIFCFPSKGFSRFLYYSVISYHAIPVMLPGPRSHASRQKKKINSLDFYSFSKGFSRFLSTCHPFGMLNGPYDVFSIIMPSLSGILGRGESTFA